MVYASVVTAGLSPSINNQVRHALGLRRIRAITVGVLAAELSACLDPIVTGFRLSLCLYLLSLLPISSSHITNPSTQVWVRV
jgi:hypothetical protein